MAIDDSVVPNVTSRALARAYGLVLVPPVVRPIDMVPAAAAAPLSGNRDGGAVTAGLFQLDRVSSTPGGTPRKATHNNVFGGIEGPGQAFHFLQTWIDAGVPEIIDPYAEYGTPPPPLTLGAPMAATFTVRTFEFLNELSVHNERPWFEANKHRYEADVREPARAFIRQMAPRVAGISPNLVADDRKVGGSLMRVHRDTRFAKDKTPYKTNVGIQFRMGHDKDVHAPGLYVHVAPDELFLGAGMWRPPREALDAIRKHIDAEQDAWRAVAEDPRLGTDLALMEGEPLGQGLRRVARRKVAQALDLAAAREAGHEHPAPALGVVG